MAPSHGAREIEGSGRKWSHLEQNGQWHLANGISHHWLPSHFNFDNYNILLLSDAYWPEDKREKNTTAPVFMPNGALTNMKRAKKIQFVLLIKSAHGSEDVSGIAAMEILSLPAPPLDLARGFARSAAGQTPEGYLGARPGQRGCSNCCENTPEFASHSSQARVASPPAAATRQPVPTPKLSGHTWGPPSLEVHGTGGHIPKLSINSWLPAGLTDTYHHCSRLADRNVPHLERHVKQMLGKHFPHKHTDKC